MTRRRFWLGLLAALALVTAADAANKTVTQVPVVLEDITRLTIERVGTGGDATVQATVTYRVRTDTGVVIGHDRALEMTLTGPQKTSLVNFLNGQALPQINGAEGT